MNERPIPEAALVDKDAVEMLRVWIAKNRLHCSMKIGMYEETTSIPEEKAWGVILADVAKHVANALESGYGMNRTDSIQKIQDSFLRELAAPTSEAKGGFAPRH